MKKYFLTLALMLSLSATTLNAVPQHRHHQQTTAVTNAPDTTSQGIEAYSDTTTKKSLDEKLDEDVDSIIKVSTQQSTDNDPLRLLTDSFNHGVGGIILAIIIVILCFLFLIAPFIILALIIRYLIKRHNDRISLAQKAMETGQPLPQSMMGVDKQTDEFLWKRGLRNMSIGLGLIIMFWFWSSPTLMGIGALVACFGGGQMIMARSCNKKDDKEDNNKEL